MPQLAAITCTIGAGVSLLRFEAKLFGFQFTLFVIKVFSPMRIQQGLHIDGLKIAAPASAAAYADTVVTSDGECAFVAGATEEGRTIYTLESLAPKIEGIKHNVALDTNFALKVYFPVLEDKPIDAVEWRGISLPMEEREIDGAIYRYVTITVAAGDAAERVVLKLRFTYGGEGYEQIVSTGVADCAKQLLGYPEYADLATAMLRYAKASYLYVHPEAELPEVYSSVIGTEDGSVTHATRDEAVNSMTSAVFSGIAVNLADGRPVYILFLADGADFAGSVKVSYTGEDGQIVLLREVLAGDSCVELNTIALYDFDKTLTISVSIDGENYAEVGRYNLSAYYEWLPSGNAENVVLALYDYIDAAQKYKEYSAAH